MVGNQWVPGPTPPGKITSASADVLGNDVFLFGGQGSSKSSSIYVLREKSNSWERISASLYQPRASHASLVVNDSGTDFQLDCQINSEPFNARQTVRVIILLNLKWIFID